MLRWAADLHLCGFSAAIWWTILAVIVLGALRACSAVYPALKTRKQAGKRVIRMQVPTLRGDDLAFSYALTQS